MRVKTANISPNRLEGSSEVCNMWGSINCKMLPCNLHTLKYPTEKKVSLQLPLVLLTRLGSIGPAYILTDFVRVGYGL